MLSGITVVHSLVELREARKANPVALLVKIMPQCAVQLMGIERKNRDVRTILVEKYAEEMREAGGWRYNGEPVTLAPDFSVINGQHRLLASVQAGVPLVTLVVFDVPAEAIHTIDIGRSRSGGDILSIEGCKNGRCVASIVNKAWQYDRGLTGFDRPSKSQVFEFWKAEPEVETAGALVHHVKRMTESLAGWLAWVTATDALEFIQQVDSGAMLEERDPRYQLREYLTVTRQKASRGSTYNLRYTWALTIKAYRLFAEGKRVDRLAWPAGQRFPMLPEELAPNAGKTLQMTRLSTAA